MAKYIKDKLNKELIRAVMQEKGLSMTDISKLTAEYYSITPSMLHQLLNDSDNITVETLIKLSLALGVTPNDLVLNPTDEKGIWDINLLTEVNSMLKKKNQELKKKLKENEIKTAYLNTIVQENKKLKYIIEKKLKINLHNGNNKSGDK